MMLKKTYVIPVIIALTLYGLVSALSFANVLAADFSSRRLELSTSETSANANYSVSFDIQTSAMLGSFVLEFCDNSPLDSVACSPPSGFDVSSAVIDNQAGETGFSVHTNTNANRLVLTRVPVMSTPQPQLFELSNIINPDTVGSHYLRVYSHSSDDGTGAFTDRGGFAFSISPQINVSAYVPPVLEFCMGIVIVGNDCSNVSGSNIDLGQFSDTATSSAQVQMAIATNAVGGYTLTLSGKTMTSGNNIIDALPNRTSSQPGVAQFGLNLRDNSTPDVGREPSGLGTGVPTTDYNSVNLYKFAEGDVIAFSPLSTDFNKFTGSFIVNIDQDQPAGYYSSTITVIALATF